MKVEIVRPKPFSRLNRIQKQLALARSLGLQKYNLHKRGAPLPYTYYHPERISEALYFTLGNPAWSDVHDRTFFESIEKYKCDGVRLPWSPILSSKERSDFLADGWEEVCGSGPNVILLSRTLEIPDRVEIGVIRRKVSRSTKGECRPKEINWVHFLIYKGSLEELIGQTTN